MSNINVAQTSTTSDHFLVSFSCLFDSMKNSARITSKGRLIKNIDISLFKKDILESKINHLSEYKDCNQAVEIYNQELATILNKHAPLQEFSINPDQSKWLDSKCQDARRQRRKAERDHRRLGTVESKKEWTSKSIYAAALIDSTRNDYYRTQLSSAGNNKKQTYSIVNQLLDRDLSKGIYPNDKPENIVASEMKDYFENKISNTYTQSLIVERMTDLIVHIFQNLKDHFFKTSILLVKMNL